MMMLLSWLPSEFLILGIVLVGMAMIVGLVAPGAGRRMIGWGLLLLLAPVVLGAIWEMLPWWLVALLLVISTLQLLRWVAGLTIGTAAADHMTGILAADVVRRFWWLFALIFLILLWSSC
jgi:hypothetical protein